MTLVAAAWACQPDPTRTTTPPNETSGETSGETGEVAPNGPTETCGPADERFANLDWVPSDARFVALVDLGATQQARASTFAKLAELDEDPAVGLPVFVAFELDGLSFGAATVDSLLDQVGLHPAEVVKLTGPDGLPVWLAPSSCDVGELSARVGDAWQMTVRETAEGRVGTTAPDATAPIPFDLLVLPADRIALVPRGKHLDGRGWLSRAAASGGDTQVGTAGGGSSAGARSIGATVTDLESAPVRAAFQGRALITPGSTLSDADPSRPRTLRADAEQASIDGSVRSR